MKASPSDTLIRETRALAQTTPYRKQKKPKSKKSKKSGWNRNKEMRIYFTPWTSLVHKKHGGTIKSK